MFKNAIKFSLCSLTFFTSTSAFCWWDQAHQLIGSIAAENVSETAHEKTLKLLKEPISYPGSVTLSENTSGFDTSASWADAIKDNFADFSSCHYIDLIIEKNMVGTNIDETTARKALSQALTAQKQNSVTCLKSAIKTLTDSSQPPLQQAISLRMVIHIIGDMVQPLHSGSLATEVGKDDGGNKTLFPQSILIPSTDGTASAQKKLHALWDATLGAYLQFPYNRENIKSGIFAKSDIALNDYLVVKMLSQKENQDIFSVISSSETQSIEDWVIDAYRIAVRDVYTDLNTGWGSYSVPRHDIVNNQLLKGGYRLAYVLNAIFDPENSTTAFQQLVYTIKNDHSILPLTLNKAK